MCRCQPLSTRRARRSTRLHIPHSLRRLLTPLDLSDSQSTRCHSLSTSSQQQSPQRHPRIGTDVCRSCHLCHCKQFALHRSDNSTCPQRSSVDDCLCRYFCTSCTAAQRPPLQQRGPLESCLLQSHPSAHPHICHLHLCTRRHTRCLGMARAPSPEAPPRWSRSPDRTGTCLHRLQSTSHGPSSTLHHTRHCRPLPH